MRIAMTKRNVTDTVRWIHEERVEEVVTFRVGKRGTEMVADWPGFARLTCAHDGSRAILEPAPRASRRDIDKLQRGQVRALLGDLKGHLALHGSAVAIGGRAVLFLGADGAGKSTAAAELCLRHGAHMLADDAASLDVASMGGVFVLPREGDHWLTHESRIALGITRPRSGAKREKRALHAMNIAGEPSPLALVVTLRFDPSAREPALRTLSGGDAARLLLNAAARFDVEDIEARRREFEQVTTVYRCAPFLELVRPLRAPGGVAALVISAL
jgi:hypothetical protein